jgi:hypothetical protein
LKGKVTPYDSSLPAAIYVSIRNKMFQSHHSDNLSKHSWESHSAFFMWPQLAVCALIPRFSGCANTIDAVSTLGVFFVSVACSFGFFGFLLSAFVNLSLDIWHASRSYHLSTVLPSGAPSVLLYWVLKHFWQGYQSIFFCSYLQSYSFSTRPDRPWDLPSLLYNGYRLIPGGKTPVAWRWPPIPSSAEVKEIVQLYIYSPSGPSWPVLGRTLPLLFFAYVLGRRRTSSGVAKCAATFELGIIIKIAESSLLLLETAASIGGAALSGT